MQPRILSRWTLAATLFLIALGGFTRGSGSGYGCKDQWPLCEGGYLGGLLPRADFNMVIEWSHRWAAAVVGLLAVLTAIAAWRSARRWVAWTAIAAIGVIGIQAWVGRLIVTNNLDADLVSLHLAISLTVALLMTVVAVATTPLPTVTTDRGWIGWLVTGAVLTAAVLVLGSLVHNVYVPGWPLTLDEWVPNLGARTIAIHFFHRVAAAASLVVTGWLVWRARDTRPNAELVLTAIAAGAVAVNVALGAIHVFTEVSQSWLVATHLGIGSAALVTLAAAIAVAAGAPLAQTSNSMTINASSTSSTSDRP